MSESAYSADKPYAAQTDTASGGQCGANPGLYDDPAIKFGLNLINFGPGASAESIGASADWAEQVGFHLGMVSDDVAVTSDVAKPYPAPFYEPFTALAWLSGRTSRVELGTTVVILPYRHPLLLARMTSSLDQLSDDYLIVLRTCWSEEVASGATRSVRF